MYGPAGFARALHAHAFCHYSVYIFNFYAQILSPTRGTNEVLLNNTMFGSAFYSTCWADERACQRNQGQGLHYCKNTNELGARKWDHEICVKVPALRGTYPVISAF